MVYKHIFTNLFKSDAIVAIECCNPNTIHYNKEGNIIKNVNIMIYTLTEMRDYLSGIGFKEKDNFYTKYLGFGRLDITVHSTEIIFYFHSFDEEPFQIKQILTLDSLYYVHSIEIVLKDILHNIGMKYMKYKIFNEIEN